jgi:hypothetical protein
VIPASPRRCLPRLRRGRGRRGQESSGTRSALRAGTRPGGRVPEAGLTRNTRLRKCATWSTSPCRPAAGQGDTREDWPGDGRCIELGASSSAVGVDQAAHCASCNPESLSGALSRALLATPKAWSNRGVTGRSWWFLSGSFLSGLCISSQVFRVILPRPLRCLPRLRRGRRHGRRESGHACSALRPRQSDAKYLLLRNAQPGLLHLAGKPDKVTPGKIGGLVGMFGAGSLQFGGWG